MASWVHGGIGEWDRAGTSNFGHYKKGQSWAVTSSKKWLCGIWVVTDFTAIVSDFGMNVYAPLLYMSVDSAAGITAQSGLVRRI